MSEGQRKQWDTLVRKCTSRGTPIRQAMGSDTKLQNTTATIRGHKEKPWEACDFLHATYDWVDLNIKAKNREHAKGKRKGWEA